MHAFIVVEQGQFADGKGTPSFQIYEWQADGTYAIVNDSVKLRAASVPDNSPVTREEAIARVHRMNRMATLQSMRDDVAARGGSHD